MGAWHSGTLAELLDADPRAIADALAGEAAQRRLDPNPESFEAWTRTITDLRQTAVELIAPNPAAAAWSYFLEFEIPRRSRRIDAVILAADLIFLLEWKVGAERFDRAAIWQVEQYALDLRDFHEGSRGRVIVPILTATNARPAETPWLTETDRLVQPVRTVAPASLSIAINDALAALSGRTAPLDGATWAQSAYRPTPTIVEAAQRLYEQHDVRDISLSGAQNLDLTVAAIIELIETCRREHRRGIAFITGAPGSGKTLAGLQVVHAPELMNSGEAAGVFLSGNMPLVNVIRAALTNSEARRGRRKQEAQREVSTFIQHAYAFRNDYVREGVPHEHVILFDEAQRAWDRKRMVSWTRKQIDRSEPEILLDVMSRHSDWAVVVAMVGSGQEINSGEAGLGEWGRALVDSHPDWIVRASPAVLPGSPTEPPGGRLFDTAPTRVQLTADDRLHLQMNVRSPRAERLNQWVDALLDLRLSDARDAMPDAREFPMAFTRSLDTAKAWLRDHCDPEQRMGLLASADARRLRAWGLDTRTLRSEKSWDEWFLLPRGDVRSSDQLEVVATNFDCQGLEIDWAGVCWGNDLIAAAGDRSWRVRRFQGSRWMKPNDELRRYILNGYRVVLTRARRGQIIWVPRPDGTDTTLPSGDFDEIADLLTAVGVPCLT